jgi:hypothetical protein
VEESLASLSAVRLSADLSADLCEEDLMTMNLIMKWTEDLMTMILIMKWMEVLNVNLPRSAALLRRVRSLPSVALVVALLRRVRSLPSVALVVALLRRVRSLPSADLVVALLRSLPSVALVVALPSAVLLRRAERGFIKRLAPRSFPSGAKAESKFKFALKNDFKFLSKYKTG